MGVKAFSKVQLGKETTPGTAVAADVVWRGPFAGIKDSRETVVVEEDSGFVGPALRTYNPQVMAELAMPVTELTPEQGGHIFEAGIKAIGTGVSNGGGYKYDYTFPTTASNVIATYSMQTGDDQAAEVADYGFVKSLTLTANKGEAVKVSANWVGRQAASGTFTSGLNIAAVTHIQAGNGRLYIDDSGDGFGSTLIGAGNVMEAKLDLDTGIEPLFTVDSGSLVYSGHYFNEDAYSGELSLKMVHKGTANTELSKWRNGTPRLVQLEYRGEPFSSGSAGDLDGYKGIIIKFPGVYTEFSEIKHEDGLSIQEAKLRLGYDAVNSNPGGIAIINELSALP